MLSLKILLSICVAVLINPRSSALNIEKGINKRAAEVSKNVQRYNFNQNHPPFADEYAPIPVAIVFEEPTGNKGKSIATTENTPTTYHPRFRNLVVVSTDVAKEASTLKSKDKEADTTTISSENIDGVATPTADGNKNIKVRGKYNVESELQIPVAVVYDNEYINLRSNPKVESEPANKIPYKSNDQKDEQREISDISISEKSYGSKNPTKPQTRSYDKVISRRNPQSSDKLDAVTESTFAQPNAQKTESEDIERVKARTQQRRRQRPRIEIESTTSGAVVAAVTNNQASLDTRSTSASNNGNPRRRLQPKATVVNETATEILHDKPVGTIKSDVKSTTILQKDNNLGDIEITPKENQPSVVKDGKYEKIKDNSNPKPTPQQRRKSVISSNDVKSDVNLQTNEDIIYTGEKSEIVQQSTRSPTTTQQRRRQPINNFKPDTTNTSTNQENSDQTTIKNTRSEIIKQDKQSNDETLVSVAVPSPTTERIRDIYQNPPQRNQSSIDSAILNAEKTADTNTDSRPAKKSSGFPAIVSTTNSRTQPQRRRQPIRTAKQDDKAGDVNATQISDIETKEKEVSIQSPSESPVTGTSEAVKKSRKLDPVVPIVESENHVYGNTGEFHYSYESGDGTKQYGDGVLKPFEDDVNGESVVGGFSYTDKDGNDFSLTYTADENGYRPVGAHLPTPPPIPPAIARALAYLATKTTPAEYDEVTESL